MQIQLNHLNPTWVPLGTLEENGTITPTDESLPCDVFDPAKDQAADPAFGDQVTAGEVARLQAQSADYLKKWTPFPESIQKLVDSYAALEASQAKGTDATITEMRANIQAYADADTAFVNDLHLRVNWMN